MRCVFVLLCFCALLVASPLHARIDPRVLIENGSAVAPTGSVRQQIPSNQLVRGDAFFADVKPIEVADTARVAEGDAYLKDTDLVITVEIHTRLTAYPIKILARHLVVHDKVDGVPVVVTYCPLSGTAQVFIRLMDGRPMRFKLAKTLYNSNIMLEDTQTHSVWQQLTGEAVVGPKSGWKLVPLICDVMTWWDWKMHNPGSFVMARPVGSKWDYTVDPYASYYESDQLYFPVRHQDDRLAPKTVVFGLELNGAYRAYLYTSTMYRDRMEKQNLFIGNDYNRIQITDLETGENLMRVRTFWFVWRAFYPETDVYSSDK